MTSLTPDTDEFKRQCHFSLLELEQQSKIHLHQGTCAAKTWFDDHRQHVLAASISEHPTEQIEALLRFVQWHFKEGQYEQSLVFALRAVHVARAAGLLALVRRSLNLLGLSYSRVGNTTEATICYVEGLKIAEQIGDRIGKAAILANLAELRFNNGLIGESIALNRYVVDIAANEPQFVQLIADAHHNIAVAALLLKDLETATREIQEAVQLSHNPTNQFLAHQSVIVEATHCRILIENGLVSDARTCARRAESTALQMNSRPAVVQASLASAVCDAAEGKVGVALERLSKVRDDMSTNDPLYPDLLEVEAVCYSFAGRKSEAAHVRRRQLSHLARFQRDSVIRQIAAFQRSVRALRALPEAELSPLPADVRKRLLQSWGHSARHDAFREYLEALASLADQREDEGGEHSFRVGRMVQLLASKVGYNGSESRAMGLAARLHDIGKLAIPDALLLKRSSLTATEVHIVRRHTVEGSQILTDILGTIERSGYLNAESIRMATEIALHHHEWWDGTGYPRQIRERHIPEAARITTIADSFDELTTRRHYRRAMPVSAAVQHMRRLRGIQFDPDICDAFADLISDLQADFGKDLEAFAAPDAELSPYQKANRVIDRIVSANQLQATSGTTMLETTDALAV